MRNRNRGQRIYEEEPDFQAPPAPPRPDNGNEGRTPVLARDFHEVRDEAYRRNQRAQNEYPQLPLNPHPGWPLSYQLPLHVPWRNASPWGGPLSAGFQLPPPGTRDFFLYEPDRRPSVLVRWHGRPRVQLYSASDSRLPDGLAQSSLTGRRRTLIVHTTGEQAIRDDRVSEGPRVHLDRAWRGGTELELRLQPQQPPHQLRAT